MKRLALCLIPILASCATADYEAYAKAQSDIGTANAAANKARFDALSQVAQTGTDTAKVAAVMALALGGQTQASGVQQVQAPQASQALQWASVLVPGLTTLASINANMRVGLANADNSARIAESTNAAFLGIAGKIQAPVTVVPVVAAPVTPQANVSTVTTTTTSDNHAVTTDSHASTVSTNSATTTTSTANPTTTTSTSIGGAGVIGSGTYSTQANPVTTTANPVTTTTTQNPITTTTTTNPPGKTCATSATGAVNCI